MSATRVSERKGLGATFNARCPSLIYLPPPPPQFPYELIVLYHAKKSFNGEISSARRVQGHKSHGGNANTHRIYEIYTSQPYIVHRWLFFPCFPLFHANETKREPINVMPLLTISCHFIPSFHSYAFALPPSCYFFSVSLLGPHLILTKVYSRLLFDNSGYTHDTHVILKIGLNHNRMWALPSHGFNMNRPRYAGGKV